MDGQYQWKVMPMGIRSSPSGFQRMMDHILGRLRWTNSLINLDDLIIYGRFLRSISKGWIKILACNEDSGLKLQLRKCRFLETTIKILGHMVSAEGVGCDPSKVEAISKFPEPDPTASRSKNVKHSVFHRNGRLVSTDDSRFCCNLKTSRPADQEGRCVCIGS